jgi:PAS domain S-box-containing protein
MCRDLSLERQANAQSRRLAAIVASSGDAIIGKTLDGRITSWNAAAQALFGYDESEAIGRPVQMLIPADRQAEEMRILRTLSQGETVPTFDTVRVTRDGRRLDMSITISPIRDDEGRVVGASKIARATSPASAASRTRCATATSACASRSRPRTSATGTWTSPPA